VAIYMFSVRFCHMRRKYRRNDRKFWQNVTGEIKSGRARSTQQDIRDWHDSTSPP